MIKRLLCIAIASILVLQTVAQGEPEVSETPSEKHHSLYVYGGHGTLDLPMLLVSSSLGNPQIGQYYAGLQYEYNINPHWSVGLGVEFHGSDGFWCFGGLAKDIIIYHKDLFSLPTYAHVRCAFGRKTIKPFVELNIGYAFSLNTVQGYWNKTVYDHTNTTYPEPGLQGPMKSGGFYTGLAAGVDIKRRHCVSTGVTCMPIVGDFVDYSTGETRNLKGLMWNFYLRYCFGFNF